jgi:hypothetical protein
MFGDVQLSDDDDRPKLAPPVCLHIPSGVIYHMTSRVALKY